MQSSLSKGLYCYKCKSCYKHTTSTKFLNYFATAVLNLVTIGGRGWGRSILLFFEGKLLEKSLGYY